MNKLLERAIGPLIGIGTYTVLMDVLGIKVSAVVGMAFIALGGLALVVLAASEAISAIRSGLGDE